ncbi:hypothetical protein C7212DRAFT_341053 [Tuber magnatum]|uniref:Uncharacterized protein n=1 Tax=Tuber magnatum TaxID=42249 RepID=A0A317SZQ0_9PEZI|nr:hypothetical protein C7212DRAFT_341053 [Tuber magnatum]
MHVDAQEFCSWAMLAYKTMQAQLNISKKTASIRTMDNIGELCNQTAARVLAATRCLQDSAQRGLIPNCITAKESIQALLVESDKVRKQVIGITQVVKGAENDVWGDYNIDDDSEDVQLRVVAIATNMPSAQEIRDLLDDEGNVEEEHLDRSAATMGERTSGSISPY